MLYSYCKSGTHGTFEREQTSMKIHCLDDRGGTNMKKEGTKNKKTRWFYKTAACAMMGVMGWMLAGCAGGEMKPEEPTAQKEVTQDSVTLEAKVEYPTEPVFTSDGEQWDYSREKREKLTETFTDAYGTFALKTSAELLKDSSENMVYSPLSLYYALALACDGAEGETQREIMDLLGYDTADALAEDCKNSFEALYHVPNEENNKPNEWDEYSQESRYSLRMANSLWVDDTLTLKSSFADRASKMFYAEVWNGDLQSEETAKKKAEWVKEQTGGLIEDAEQPEDAQTLLSLVNTVYFYDEWVNRFDSEKTENGIFTTADGIEVDCDFMNAVYGSAGFRRGENYVASSLSLKNGSVEFVLPDEGVDVHELAATPEVLGAVIGDGGESMFGKVTWSVPKFSYGSDLPLVNVLKELGVKRAFDDADFSNISDDDLFISNVLQKAHIGVNEEGVECAAFTEILYAGAALPVDEAEMILDRPFLYAVKNQGQVLFVGICENPAAQ